MVDEPKQDKLCDIIVPTHNKVEHTEKFVKSFLEHTPVPTNVIFVDNGSGDGTREFLSTLTDTELHSFTVILNNENKGYVLAMNQGLSMSKAPYVCFSNNDVIFTRGWLEEAILTFKEYPSVGLLNPNSNNLNFKPKKNESIDVFADRLKKTYSKGSFIDMPFCIGFCMLVRRIALDAVGGFDEAFAPMFFEDSDYSRRVYKAGYRLGISRRSYVWHAEHGSMDQLGKKQKEYFEKSKKVYLSKWGKTLRIAWVIEEYDDLKKSMDDAVACGRNANFIWFWVKGLTKDRKEIFKDADVHDFADIKFMPYEQKRSILWKAITKKKKYDLVITQNIKLRRMLNLFGQTTAKTYNASQIQELKFKGLK